jgi:hypothetical protein
VLADLVLAEAVLSADGIIAVDDFLCPEALGVNEAVNRYFATARPLVPFAYTANKLFLCRSAAAERYFRAFESSVVADQRDARSANFRACLPDLRWLVDQPLFGSRVIVVP